MGTSINKITKALLKDLQDDLERIKHVESNIEVVWQLDKLKTAIDFTKNKIRESI